MRDAGADRIKYSHPDYFKIYLNVIPLNHKTESRQGF